MKNEILNVKNEILNVKNEILNIKNEILNIKKENTRVIRKYLYGPLMIKSYFLYYYIT